MKRIFTLLFCLLAAASATSGHTAERQGEACSTTHAADSSIRPAKKSVTQRREVRRFEEIAASSGITILVRQADEWTVEVSADKNIIDRVQTEVVGKTLRIRYRNNTSINGRHEPTVVRVSCPVLTNISATSGTDITFTNLFEGEALTVHATSAARIDGAIRYGSLMLSATSGADITLTGRSRHSTLTATSGANIDASALVSEEVSASATSGAHVKTYAHTRLTAKATSGAIVVYYGNPTQTDISATSGGSIRKRPCPVARKRMPFPVREQPSGPRRQNCRRDATVTGSHCPANITAACGHYPSPQAYTTKPTAALQNGKILKISPQRYRQKGQNGDGQRQVCCNRFRYCDGVVPIFFRKTRIKCGKSLNPAR